MGLFNDIKITDGFAQGVLNNLSEVPLGESLIVLDLETNSLSDDAKIHGIGIRTQGENYFVPWGGIDKEALSKLLTKASPLVLHNAMFDLNLLQINGVQFTENIFCTQVASWLENENTPHNLAHLAYEKFKIELTEYSDFKNPDLIQLAVHCKKQLYATELLYDFYMETGDTFMLNLEMKILPILLSMQKNGILIDKEVLKKLKEEYEVEIKLCSEKINKQFPKKIDLESPQQLSTMLFDTLGIKPIGDKGKAGYYSTDRKALEKLKNKHPICNELLEFRAKVKTQNTFIEPLLHRINPIDDRVHPHFKPTGTRVGRLSSVDPNVQQVTNKERRIRKIYKAPEGSKLLVCDYSQMHLRILAHLSKDALMLSVFNDPKGDIHQMTADMNSITRDDAKIVNFGIIYGFSHYSLAEFLKVPEFKGKEILESYKQTYPGIFIFKEKVIGFFRHNKYVYTVLGRKRRLEFDNSFTPGKKGYLEREAFNSVIVGSEADIMKSGMINLYCLSKEYGFKIINQVHDEIVLEIEENKINKELLEKIQKGLDYPFNDIVINSEIVICDNWGEKKTGEKFDLETYEGR